MIVSFWRPYASASAEHKRASARPEGVPRHHLEGSYRVPCLGCPTFIVLEPKCQTNEATNRKKYGIQAYRQGTPLSKAKLIRWPHFEERHASVSYGCVRACQGSPVSWKPQLRKRLVASMDMICPSTWEVLKRRYPITLRKE